MNSSLQGFFFFFSRVLKILLKVEDGVSEGGIAILWNTAVG